MKTLVITAAMLSSLCVPAQAADLTMHVTNISEVTGNLYWKIFDSAQSYQSDSDAVMAGTSQVGADSMRLTLHDMPPGEYAVKLFHDANSNGQLDSNLLGIPTEGYGFSNDAGRFGPPEFEEAAVLVDTDIVMTIRVRQ